MILLYLGILASIIIRAFFIATGADVADIKKLHEMGEAFLRGANPYQVISYNVYPPLAVYLEGVTLWLSNILNVPFQILTKIWPNLADVAITLFLYKSLIRLKVRRQWAILWSLLYILNPVTILISAAHGQIDSITNLLILLAIYWLTIYQNRQLLAFLMLGLAIAIKPNPAMLLPLFLVYSFKDFRQIIKNLIAAILPFIITSIPYLLASNFSSIFNYSGVYDFSYSAILRGLFYQDNANYWLPLSEEFLNASKLTFLIGAALIILLFSKKDLVRGCLALYLMFLGIYFGISAQYLIWILPLAILLKDKIVIPFSIFGTIAILGFYLFFGPEILGTFAKIAAFQSKFMPIYFFGNLFLWMTIIWWLVRLVRSQIIENFKTASLLYKRAVIFVIIIFGVSLIPILDLIRRTFNT